MQDILYLAHRIPYPPNKGDKVRSYNILEYLTQRYRVHLGTFVDHPDDWQHVPALKERCASVQILPLSRWQGRLRCLSGFLRGQALSVAWYRDAEMQRWVDATVARHHIQSCVIFSAAMQQFADQAKLETVLDLVDVDSEKWRRYADDHAFPLSWVYRREAAALLRYESASALKSRITLLSTPAEAALLAARAPECAHKLGSMQNGVDTQRFAPDLEAASPYPNQRPVMIFTGAMDYWPNIDAVRWFTSDILPLIRAQQPDAVFYIVGSNPHAQVRALHDGKTVFVTGTVPSIQPYLQHSTLAVVPIRIARGIQNKVLEAMAMAKAVIVTTECARALGDPAQLPLCAVADGTNAAAAFAVQTVTLLQQHTQAKNLGQQARNFVQNEYNWPTRLGILDTLLPAHSTQGAPK
ncbi:MAG: TIGR03087 family PEP-CTERM/XrtA system glycosyltransferase [Burkholderiaceae bacterium]|nr:MAG: TIGR03087 family PEP-CTERM/XrtA system glycosyltransferase [Burkholderiaceae bacterium]